MAQEKTRLQHIDGLRGAAILLILLFHIDPRMMSYGFRGYLGVESFFVISGYFLLLGMRRAETFSCVDFLVKKWRRIFVPMAVLVGLCFLGALWFPYQEMAEAGRTGTAALFGVSNIYLSLSGDGYFDITSASNPLLHTWYVSALLQMFVALSVGFTVLKDRVSGKICTAAVVILGTLSFVWGNLPLWAELTEKIGYVLPWSFARLAPNYYDSLPRLWELMAGGTVIYLRPFSRRWLNSLCVIVGAAMVLVPSAGMLSAALCPLSVVVGTVLLMVYLPGSLLQALACLKPLLWVGKISFSLYLVHVPFFVFYRSFMLIQRPTVGHLLVMFATVLLLSWVFWRVAETRKFGAKAVAVVYLIPVVMGGVIIATQGLKTQLHAEANSYEPPPYELPSQECCDAAMLADYPMETLALWHGLSKMTGQPAPSLPLLRIGNPAKKASFLYLGDSHAHALYPGLLMGLEDSDVSGVFAAFRLSSLDCRTKTETDWEQERALKAWLARHPEIKDVVIAVKWSGWYGVNPLINLGLGFFVPRDKVSPALQQRQQVLRQLCLDFQAMGRRVILLTEVPKIEVVFPLGYVRQSLIIGSSPDHNAMSCTPEQYRLRNTPSLSYLERLEKEGLCTLVHMEKPLMDEGVFVGFSEGKILYYDDNHLNPHGALYIIKKVKADLLQILSPPASVGVDRR